MRRPIDSLAARIAAGVAAATGAAASHAAERLVATVEVPDFTRGVWETTPPLAIVGG